MTCHLMPRRAPDIRSSAVCDEWMFSKSLRSGWETMIDTHGTVKVDKACVILNKVRSRGHKYRESLERDSEKS